MSKKGIFISIEGLDGAGKTTQIKHLKDFFEKKNYTVHCFREPGATELGEDIRFLLLKKRDNVIHPCSEMLLFTASRYELVHSKIIPALKENAVVICDRFTDSSIAYQGFGSGIDYTTIETLNDLATSKRYPDLTILLDITIEESLRRTSRRPKKAHDRFESENISFYERVYSGFSFLAQKYSKRIFKVNAMGKESIIAKDIQNHILFWMKNEKII